MANAPASSWIGARLLRKEDARYLIGAGMFIADSRMPGMQDVAFVRRQMAHARVRGVPKPAGAETRALAPAPIRMRRQLLSNRQATVSLECGGSLAYWDHRPDELVIHLSTQGGHVMRLGLAQALGLSEHKIRVIAPDVGGGFGGKNRLM